MSTHFGTYTSHSNSLDCPGCGAQGALRWENAPTIYGGQQLLAIEGDFYERLARRKPYAIELVCNGCGTVQKAAQRDPTPGPISSMPGCTASPAS